MQDDRSIPFVHIDDTRLAFSASADRLIDSPRLLVAKSADRVIFRPTRTSHGFKVSRYKSCPSRAYIASRLLSQYVGLRFKAYYRLFPCEGGFYIKRYEPLEGAEMSNLNNQTKLIPKKEYP